MSGLISQNADRKKKVKRKVDDEALAENGKEMNAVAKLSDPDAKTKKKRKQSKKDEEQEGKEMKNLENMLFGSIYSPVEFGKDNEVVEEGDDIAIVLDRSGNSSMPIYQEDGGLLGLDNNEDGRKERKPVWEDEEEEEASVNIAKVNKLRKLREEEDESVISGASYISRLRAQHVKLNPGTDWASLDSLDSQRKESSSDEDDSDIENVDDILRGNKDLVVKSDAKLLPGLLGYTRLANANAEDPSNAPISSVEFHRNSQLLLVGGFDKKLRFFQIDGKHNHKVQSIFLEDCPIRKACFLPDGSQVLISGRRKFFYSLDLVKATVDKIGPLVGREEKSLESFEVSPDSDTIAFCGNEGYILLVSSRTKELIGTLKMNGTVRSMAFTSDGQQLLTSGGDGQIYTWDLRTRKCLHKGTDEGCITGTSLCTSPVGDLFAAGSNSGIVNIYNRGEFLGGKRKPIKAIENLTTSVTFMKFNIDAKVLAIGSRLKRDSLKLVHIPSYTVFSNWPPPSLSLHFPTCLDFSPHGGFMAAGNAAGQVLLYKLHHYHQA